MININILTYLDYNLFDQQLDLNRFSKDFCFFENSNLDIEWDMVIVFETTKTTKTIKCKKGGLVFIAAEPPMSSVYSNLFLKQFDILFTAHPNIKNFKNIIRKQYFNDWHFGFDTSTKKHRYSFEEIKYLKIPEKIKNISVITSSLAVLPIHLKRLDFISKLKQIFGNEIDFFGRGFNFVDDKADAILPYRFHICVENTNNNDLWTEKFADPLIGYSVPIYIGCTNMDEYFPKDSFYSLNINDPNGAINILNEILADPIKCYNEKLDKLLQARNLLINDYNIYPTLVNLHLSKKINLGNVITINIKPNNFSLEFVIKNYKLRLERFIFKKFYNLKKILK